MLTRAISLNYDVAHRRASYTSGFDRDISRMRIPESLQAIENKPPVRKDSGPLKNSTASECIHPLEFHPSFFPCDVTVFLIKQIEVSRNEDQIGHSPALSLLQKALDCQWSSCLAASRSISSPEKWGAEVPMPGYGFSRGDSGFTQMQADPGMPYLVKVMQTFQPEGQGRLLTFLQRLR